MPKIKLVKIAEENGVEFDEALNIAKNSLPAEMLTGKGKATWVSEEGQDLLAAAIDVPELHPKQYKGTVVRLAPNPSYVYANVEELGRVIPCVVPRKFQSRMLKKSITIEEIKDASGSTFRQVKQNIF